LGHMRWRVLRFCVLRRPCYYGVSAHTGPGRRRASILSAAFVLSVTSVFFPPPPPPQHPFFPPPGRSKAPPSPALVIDNLNQPLPTHSSCCYSPHSHNRISSPTGGSSQPPSPSPPFLPGPDQTHGILGCLLLLLVLGFIDMRFAVLRERPVLRCIASHLMAGKNTAVLTRPAQHNWPSRSSFDMPYVLSMPSIRVGLVPSRVSGVLIPSYTILELVPPRAPSTLD
jgi:hypothetical protein